MIAFLNRFSLSQVTVDSPILLLELQLGDMDLIHQQIMMTMETTVEDLVTNMIKQMVNVEFAETHTLMNLELMKHLVVFTQREPLPIATHPDK